MKNTHIIFSFLILFYSIALQAQIEKDSILESVLDKTIEELMNTKVSIATKSEKRLSESPAIISVFTAEEMKNFGARDLRDVLRIVPGFQLGMRDLGYTTIGIRGITTPNSEKVKIMIDGIPVNENLEGSGAIVFADMTLDNVERIEIIRGPGSALYGTNAFMGVINIISKKAKDIDGVVASIKGGTYNTFEVNLIAGKEFDDFEINASFDYLTTDGPKQKIEIDVLSTDSSGISLAGTDKGYTKLFRKKITSSLNMDYKGLYSKTLYIGTEKGDYVGPASAINENSKAQHFQIQQMLGYKHSFSDKLSIDINTAYLLYNVDNLWNTYPPGFAGVFTEGMYQEMGWKQQSVNVNAQMNYDFSKKNMLQIGVSYAYIKLFDEIYKSNTPGTGVDGLVDIPSAYDRDVLTREIGSAYIQDNWDLHKMLSITAGVRLDNYSDAGITINPRTAIVFKPTEKLNFKLLFGSAFRAPTFVESYLNAPPFLIGDENIEPETIKTHEAYLSYILNKSISISVNYFYNNITNLITIVPDTSLSIGKYINSDDKINVQGIETEIKILLPQVKTYAYITYTYQKGINTKTDENIIGMANHTAFAGINYGFSNNLNISLYANYIGIRERASIDTRENLDGFTLLNLSIQKKELFKNFNVQISAYNLLDSDFRVPDVSGKIYNDYPLEGINFFAEISYKF